MIGGGAPLSRTPPAGVSLLLASLVRLLSQLERRSGVDGWMDRRALALPPPPPPPLARSAGPSSCLWEHKWGVEIMRRGLGQGRTLRKHDASHVEALGRSWRSPQRSLTCSCDMMGSTVVLTQDASIQPID